MASSTAVIKIAQKQAGLDDDTYRDKLFVITGKTSTRDMTEAERQLVITVFRNEGFEGSSKTPSSDNQSPRTGGRYRAKLQALWIAGHNLGVIRDRTDAALEAFVMGQTKVDALRFVHKPGDAKAAIEALKKWIARDGGVNWNTDKLTPDYAKVWGFQIAWAQWIKLGGTVHADSVQNFWKDVNVLSGVPGRELSTKAWQRVMNKFGERVRKLGKKAK